MTTYKRAGVQNETALDVGGGQEVLEVVARNVLGGPAQEAEGPAGERRGARCPKEGVVQDLARVEEAGRGVNRGKCGVHCPREGQDGRAVRRDRGAGQQEPGPLGVRPELGGELRPQSLEEGLGPAGGRVARLVREMVQDGGEQELEPRCGCPSGSGHVRPGGLGEGRRPLLVPPRRPEDRRKRVHGHCIRARLSHGGAVVRTRLRGRSGHTARVSSPAPPAPAPSRRYSRRASRTVRARGGVRTARAGGASRSAGIRPSVRARS